jgi:uncharacterized membrane protein
MDATTAEEAYSGSLLMVDGGQQASIKPNNVHRIDLKIQLASFSHFLKSGVLVKLSSLPGKRANQTMSSTRLLASLLALVAFGNLGSFCEATVACSSTQECESTHMEGSRCVKGVCVANSYHDGGCLKSLLPDWHKIRVCNSDDPPSSAEKGFCRPSPLDYTEVRRLSQNWESAFFGTWILQILLSEILDVPVSVETGFPELNVDFYNIDSSFDYGGANDWDAMSTGTLVGDCRDLKTYDPEEYQACGHVIPEVWSENLPTIRQYEKDGVLEAPVALGALAAQIWFVPKFTVERDPTLMNYIGLQGEENRRKLAERFKRPTSWKDYCEEVSATKCSDEDEVASRPPRTEGEESSMFAEGLYTGHFRSSEKNDCEINNSTCTGHISDYPCGWNSFIKQQTYHLNIPLESSGPEASGGYSYSQLPQIWAAANATKSDVMMLWWFPDALYTTYLGTDAEFTPVVLPPPTQSCLDARINVNDRCGDDVALKVGSAEGSCDNPPQSLQKVIGATLRDLSEDPSVPVELWSPAYEAIMNYQINELQLGEIFDERKNYVARETTCRWVAENIDLVMSFVPKSYPRVVEKEDISDSGASIAALAFACLAALMVLVSFYFTVQQRKTRVMYNAQVEFMYLLLGGTLLISLGALLMTREVTKTLCSAIPWTVHVGYILVVFPVVLRVDATNCLLNSGKQLQRVRLDTGKHFGWVAVGVVAVAVHMVTWTILDPIQAESDYRLTSDINEFGESILSAASKCSSESDLWLIGITAVVTLFLLYGLVLSFMASRVKEDSNETKNLAVLILVQFIAAIIRLSGLFMRESFDSENTMANRSLLLSIEVILVLLIFVIPKLLEKSDTDRDLWTISHEAKASERREQLVDWNVQVLTKLIKQIVARRNATFAGRSLLAPSTYLRGESGEQVQNSTSISSSLSLGNGRPLDEVKEIIKLPDFDKRVARRQQIAESIELPAAVIHELKLFVVAISSLYQDNPFHNFAYAS